MQWLYFILVKLLMKYNRPVFITEMLLFLIFLGVSGSNNRWRRSFLSLQSGPWGSWFPFVSLIYTLEFNFMSFVKEIAG